jgi:tetratricopeptide (TPR) repeat protein
MPLELERLVGDVKWAKAHRFPARELRAMLRRLVAEAPEGSEERRFARVELATMLLESEPWLAARMASDALRCRPDEQTYSLLGIAHTLLGHYRSAMRAHRRALELGPSSAEHEHNLGHLLDVAFNRPLSALPHLRRAFRGMPDEPEVASSLAHALVRLGRIDEAERLLTNAFVGDRERARTTVAGWLSNSSA